MLGISIVFVGVRTYQLWQTGPWDLPAPTKSKGANPLAAVDEQTPFQLVSTRNIVEKNLFDPERGATKKNEAVAQAEAQATQRIRSMVLLGTAILGSSRYAILQEPSNQPQRTNPNVKTPQPQRSGQMRVKQGDIVEGFRLAEVRDKSVVFIKGASKVELGIDFFRPVKDAPPQTAAPTPLPARPGLSPRVGARAPQSADQAQPGQDGTSAVDRARRALRERALQPPQQPAAPPPARTVPPPAENAPANPQ